MTNTVRVMDEQKDLKDRLDRLFENFKKERVDRRTNERLTFYENQLTTIWTSFEKNHATLMAADPSPPDDYVKLKYLPTKSTYESFRSRMADWVVNIPDNKGNYQLPSFTVDDQGKNPSPSLEFNVFDSDQQFGTTPSNLAQQTVQATQVHPIPTVSTDLTSASIPIDGSQPFQSSSNADPLNELTDPNQQNSGVWQLLKMLTQNQNASRNLRPPEIHITPFDGNVKHFRQFKEMFIRAISGTDWSNIELFMFLKSKLQGEALDAISNMEITSASYTLAWEILDRRFNNKRKLLETTMAILSTDECRVEHNNIASGKSFVNCFQNIRANLKQLKATPDEILMELLLTRMDEMTRSRFEDHIGMENHTPSFEQLEFFFEKEMRIWSNYTSKNSHPKSKSLKTKLFVTSSERNSEVKCFICQKNHVVSECEQFLSSNDREKLLRYHRICIYCTRHKYKGRFSPCISKKNLKCDICQQQHITLMHPLSPDVQAQDSRNSSGANPSTVCVTQSSVLQDKTSDSVSILPTAVIPLLDNDGGEHSIRCLIDLCAERSYVCEHVVQKLRLKKFKTNIRISGINEISGSTTSFVKLVLKVSEDPSTNISVDALVIPKITGMIPTSSLPKEFNKSGYKLADPSFQKQSFIGALIGSDIAPKLYIPGMANEITPDGFLLQPTVLGWIVSGSSSSTKSHVSTFVTLNENFEKMTKDEQLSKRILDFYELPEIQDNRNDYCENLYAKNHYRQSDGRYVVPIPWKEDAEKLGHSYRKALKLFVNQESKWCKNPKHYQASNDFMREYQDLEHMTQVTKDVKSDSSDVYYIPYLSIIREGVLTTKLRNVFNASMPTSNGISLNDTMLEGPKLQTNIKDVLITARSFKYMYSSDISKMFRQILVLPEDREKMRIIWRSSVDSPIKEFRLNTITYGTDAAPFLAIRTVHQCGQDNATPEIAAIIKKAFYVDDLLYGADTTTEAVYQIMAIKNALAAGKLPLMKWMSNCEELLTHVTSEERITSHIAKDCKEVKLLGVLYNFETDHFQLNVKQPDKVNFTKRGISSVCASFYDPLGFILPFIMMLRIFLQRVWKQKVEWDETIDDTYKHQFKACVKNVTKLNNIKIPRHIPCYDSNLIELIGFSDASSSAQAAVIYSRIKTSTGFKVTLLTSKGNVAKTKTSEIVESKQCTIPKLELEAVLTLIELYKNIQQNFSHRNIKFTAYTDSQVVLAWVRNSKRHDKKFIERRVSKIKAVISPEQLHYVKSEDNPADPASRGLTAEQLSSCTLWFLGPSWLQQDDLPSTPYKKEVKTLTTQVITPTEELFSRFSNWHKVLRITAYCLRWISHGKGFIKATEITVAKQRVLRYYQHLHLEQAINNLQKGKLVPKKHWLYKLSPFLDKDGLVRVGGRLGNAYELPESQRHPIVFPKSHGLTIMINSIHSDYIHANNALMLRFLIEDYWIPGIKNLIKSCVQKCVKCRRWQATILQPEMSQLPKERVTPSSTFENIGVDLCGPFIIKASPLKFDRTMKVWIVNFVCFSTKAVHLELVTSLSTDNFLAAFSRFCSRRGTSTNVWSDNGTNLVGSNRMIKEAWDSIVKDSERRTAIQEITWHFIPRHSPTFGGLWEACVKSLKYFVKRMADVKNLTYEEFTTLLCKIEAMLNSRPLCANPLTPEESPALTPFHFINQRGYKPKSTDGVLKVPLTKKWVMIHKIQQEFWLRFKTEYLRELQIKLKWQKPQANLSINDVVLIKEPSTTPGDWKMGIVSKTYPDLNGVVRKVDIFTPSKQKTLHAVNQLVPLLKNTAEEESTQNNLEIASAHNLNENPGETSVPNTRKSQRLANKISLVHLCLFILLTWIPTSATSTPEPLQPGIHLRKLGNIYLKSFDLPFSVKTNMNLTQDLELIQKTTEDFNSECLKLSGNFTTVIHHCTTLYKNIARVADEVATEMKKGYHSTKQKRWISITSKGLWKAAPFIATTLGMAYQESEIWTLKGQLADTKSKMAMTANILLNITDLEYEAIDGKLNELISKQQSILVEETILNYAENIQLLFTSLKYKHDEVTMIKPYNELMEYLTPVLLKLPAVRIPELGDEIFNVYPPSKSIESQLTVVTFTIPIVLKQESNVWAIISNLHRNGKAVLLTNNKKVQLVIVSSNNKTIADITRQHSVVYANIIENIHLLPMDNCTSAIFDGGDISTCSLSDDSYNEQIFTLCDDLVVVFTNPFVPVSLECNSTPYTIPTQAVIVNTSDCSIISGNQAMGRLNTPISIIDVTEINDIAIIYDEGVSPVTRNPIAQDLRKTLKEKLSMWIQPNTGTIIIECILITLLIYTIVIICRCCRSTRTDTWFPEYVGPTRATV